MSDEPKKAPEGPMGSYCIHNGVAKHPDDLIPKREPCECPECGSAAASVQITAWAVLDGLAEHGALVIAGHLGVSSSGIIQWDEDVDGVPDAVRLYCEDCGHEWDLPHPVQALIRLQWEE